MPLRPRRVSAERDVRVAHRIPHATVHVVDDGDHSFAVRARSGRDRTAVRDEIVDASLRWLASAVQV